MFALAQLMAPASARAATATGVVFNNLSLSTALNADPTSPDQADDIVVRTGDRLYLGASADPSKLSGWITLDDGTRKAFAAGDYTLTDTGDHEYTVAFPGQAGLSFSVVESESVPSMYIRTTNGLDWIETSKDNEDVGGAMSLVNADGTTRYNGVLSEMKGRGNSTWVYPKKPYQIKLDKSTELVTGAGAHKTWILLANYLDASLLRNKVAYEMESAVLQRAGAADYAIKGQMIDLFIDGGYRGSYYLTEKVQVAPTRIAITDTDKLNSAINTAPAPGDAPTARADVTSSQFAGLKEAQYVDFPNTPDGYQQAGYLFEMDFASRSREERSYFITGLGTPMTVKAPEDANAPEVAFAGGYIQDFEDALYAPSGVNADGKSWRDYIDVPSFARAYALHELLANDDAFKSSTYFYMDKGGKLMASPLWDCDRCLGALRTTTAPEEIHVGKWSRPKPRWIKQLLSQNDFRTAVQNAYTNEVAPEAATIQSTKLAEWASEIAYSAKMNKLRWSPSSSSVSFATPAEDITHLRQYLTTRRSSLAQIISASGYTKGANLPDGIYTVRNGQLVLDVNAASTANGANVQLYTANGTDAQRFRVTRGNDGFYTLINVRSGKALDVQGAAGANGTNVQQYTANGTLAQKWVIGTWNGTTYTIASALGTPAIASAAGPANGWVLNAAGNGTTKGTNINIWSDTGQSGQQFTFGSATTPTPEPPVVAGRSYAIASALNRTKVLDVAANSSANGTNIRIYSDNGSRAQRFTFTAAAGGSYVIRTGPGGAVDVAYAGKTNGTNVWQWAANGSLAQQWILKPTGDADKSYYVVSRLSGLYLDVARASTANGTNVQTWTSNGSKAQKFYLVAK
ncbi:RICIN domain-containing protein [Actinomycetota bacterium]